MSTPPVRVRVGLHCTLHRGTGVPRSLECYSSTVQTSISRLQSTRPRYVCYPRETGTWNMHSCCSSAAQIHISDVALAGTHFIWHSGRATWVSHTLAATCQAWCRLKCHVDGRTLLHVSAQRGDKKVARELMNLEVDISSRDNQGRTPLEVALERDSEEAVRLLLEYGYGARI